MHYSQAGKIWCISPCLAKLKTYLYTLLCTISCTKWLYLLWIQKWQLLVHSLVLYWQNLIAACLFHNMPELLERRSLWTLHGCSLPYSSWFTFSWDHLTELTVCESLWLCRWLWSLSSKWKTGLKDPVMFLVLCNQWSSCFPGRSIFGGSGEVRETREGINYTANLQLSCMILR
jgi:hypothetical protein